MIAILTVAARLAVIAIFSGVMFLVVSQSAASPTKSRAEARIEALNAQIREARRQNAVLKERLEYRRSDGFILAAAKRDLMLIEPGDILLELDGPLPLDPSPSGPRTVEESAVRHVPGLLDIGYIRAWRNALLGQP